MKFNNAPIAEVVIGAQFSSRISNENIYEFYQILKERFPKIKENPILPTIIEKLDRPSDMKILPGFNSRKFFSNEKDSKLIQIQQNRLLFNWKKSNNKEEYPHFTLVFEEFSEIFNLLNKLSGIKKNINQAEVTYLDHIQLNDFNIKSYNSQNVFNIINFNPEENIKHLKLEVIYPDEEIGGNLILNIASAVQNVDNTKIFRLETTCRGEIGENNFESWYYLAHEKLLDVFKRITTDNAKKIWGLVK